MASEGGRSRVLVDGTQAMRTAELLELLAELPSTPTLVAEEARYRAAELSWTLPDPHVRHEPGERLPMSPVGVDVLAATGMAGLLDLLAGMPSTPPALADEAMDQADLLWTVLARRP